MVPPLITGLYTLVLPVLLFALLGSSRHLVVGADSATAAIVASALAGLAVLGSPEYVALTSMVALLAGALILIARLLDLGFLANFLSRTVLIGFLTGVGIQVALGQVPDMLGIAKPAGGILTKLIHVLSHISQSNHTSLIIVAIAFAIIILFEFLAPRWPGALIAVIGMIVMSRILDLKSYGVEMVGNVPQGLPHLHWPAISLNQTYTLFSVSFSCAVVILAQSAATARAYALRDNDSFDENSDLIGLGFGNLASALSGSFVINGSPTKTAIVDNAGGRSQIAQLSMVAMVLLVLLFLTSPLAALPVPILSTIVFIIGIKLVDRRGMTDLFRRNRNEFWLALLTTCTVVIFGVMPGIILALVMSLLYHVRTSYKPQTALLSPAEDGHWLSSTIKKSTYTQAAPGMLVYWFGADLFYANISHFIDEVHQIAKFKPLRWLVIDAGSITTMDYSAGRDIVRLNEELKEQGTELVWVHVRGELNDKLNEFRKFESLRDCVSEYQKLSL